MQTGPAPLLAAAQTPPCPQRGSAAAAAHRTLLPARHGSSRLVTARLSLPPRPPPSSCADLSELDLPKNVSIRFPEGKDKIMNFEITLKADEGTYKWVGLCAWVWARQRRAGGQQSSPRLNPSGPGWARDGRAAAVCASVCCALRSRAADPPGVPHCPHAADPGHPDHPCCCPGRPHCAWVISPPLGRCPRHLRLLTAPAAGAASSSSPLQCRRPTPMTPPR